MSASQFVPGLDEVMEDAMAFLHNNLETVNSEDFLPSLLKIFMEVTGILTLDHRSHDMILLDIFTPSLKGLTVSTRIWTKKALLGSYWTPQKR